MSTITRTGLRELICDAVRQGRGGAPYDLTDEILTIIKRFAPKAFVENHADVDGEGDKYQRLAEEMIRSHAFDVAQYEIHAAWPKLTDAEVQAVDDAVGMASIVVTF